MPKLFERVAVSERCAFRRLSEWLVANLFAFIFVSGTLIGPALADDPSLAPPPVHQIIDANGVNLTTGQNTVAGPSISIGQPGKSGLSYSVKWMGRNWESNFASSISYSNSSNDRYTVMLMGQSYSFQQVGTVFNSTDGMGETLTLSGSSYTFTARDGTVAVFDGSHTFSYAIFTTVGLLNTVTYPSGEVLTFTQQVVSSILYVLQSVNSSLGYQIKFFYDGSYNTTQVVAINNAVDYCVPNAISCSFSQSWPTLNFTYPVHSGGYAAAITDSNGNTTTGSFTSTIGQIENRVSYPSGRYLSYVDNNLDNMIDTVTDGTSTWNYTYSISSTDVVTQVTDPIGHVRLVDTNAATGVMESDRLDPSGLNLTTAFTYDTYGRATLIVYPALNAVQITYDSRGNITQETQISSTPGTPPNIVTTASFPSSCSNPLTCNKPDSVTDANGNTTSYTYSSSNGGILTVTSPPVTAGTAQTRNTYTALYAWYKNSSGSIVQAPAPVYMLTQTSQCLLSAGNWGAVTWGAFVWSSSGGCVGTSQENLTSYSYPAGSSGLATNLLPSSVSTGAGDASVTATVSTSYDTIGNTSSVTGPLSGSTTVFFYDADRNQIGIVKPDPDGGGPLANPATKISYNADSQVLETDQGTTPSQSYYDFVNNFSSLTQAVNGYSSATGAKTGTASAIGGSVQSITQYSFDGARDPLCTAVRQTASLFGSLSSPFGSLPGACTQSTSSNNDLITHNDYDTVNRLSAVESGYGSSLQQTTVTNSYTVNSKIASVTDANGNQSAYTYDGLDRLVQLNFPDPSTRLPNSADYESYGYDGNGNITSQRLRSGETASYSYDALNRQTVKSFSGGSTPSVYTAYDLTGDILYAHYGSAGGSGVDYTWDALGRKTSETSYGRKVSSQYDLAGNRTRLTYPDGNYVQYTYDILNRMQQVQQNGSTVMVQYSYDNLGRISAISRNNGSVTNYSYDSTDQNWSLTQNNITQSGTFAMSYTPAGQVAQRTISNSAYAYSAPSLSQSYSPNGLNQYANVGGVGYGYDARGNLTSNSSRGLNYDLENHLTSTAFTSPSVALTYDPLGRLNQETVVSTTEQFLYDGNNLIAEYDSSGNVLRRYIPGQGVDETLVWYEGSDLSSPRWLHTDQQGSVVATSDSSGTATTYTYSATGQPNTWSGPRFRYTGQAAIPELALYYYKARMYDPALGRFLQTDPVGYRAGLNLYAYVGNDPVNNTDPTGHAAACEGSILVGEDYIPCPITPDAGTETSTCPAGVECVTSTATREPAAQIASNRGQPSRAPDITLGAQPIPPGINPKYPPGASCRPARNFLTKTANFLDDVSTYTGRGALVAGGAALVSSETIVGGVGFGTVATGLGIVSAGSAGLAGAANFFGGRYGNAAVDVFSVSLSLLGIPAQRALSPTMRLASNGYLDLMSEAASSVCPGG